MDSYPGKNEEMALIPFVIAEASSDGVDLAESFEACFSP
jgi:hypothetical protein